MNCESFWKRVITFCLALGIGTVASDSWVEKYSQKSKDSTVLISKDKTCVFADKDLQYQTLPLKEEKYILPEIEHKPELKPIPSEKKKLKKTETETNPDNIPRVAPQLHIPSQSSAQYRTLLHLENCYESGEIK